MARQQAQADPLWASRLLSQLQKSYTRTEQKEKQELWSV